MRYPKVVVLVAALVSFSAWAQPPSDAPKSPILFDLGAGATFPTGAANPRFDPGWNAKAGLGANLTQQFAVLAEYLFSSLPATGKIEGSDISGRQYLHTFGVSGMLSVGKNSGFSAYIIGGPQGIYRRVTISQYAGTAIAPYCDPYFFYCYATPVSYSNVLGTRDEWDFGLDGGLGVQYGFGTGEPHLFVEGRYQYVFGQTYSGLGRSVSSSAGFIPVIAGLRW